MRGETMETLRMQAEEAIRRADIRCSWEIAFRQPPVDGGGFDGGFMPYASDGDDPTIRSLFGSIERICGKAPGISYMPSIGDFNNVGGLLGIPCVLWGPAGANYHSADEYVELDSVAETADVLYDFLMKINGGCQ